VTFSDDELAYLEGSTMGSMVAEWRKSVHHRYDTLCAAIPEVKEFGFELFRDTEIIVGSRALETTDKATGKE